MCFTKASIAVIALVAIAGYQTTVSAQSGKGGNGNPEILEAVQALQRAIERLQASVDTVSASTSQGNSRFTPFLVANDGDSVRCFATNISTASQTVRMQLIGVLGSILADTGATGLPISPGQSLGIRFSNEFRFGAFCNIVVIDGSRTDIRGVLTILDSSGADKVVVAAE
jgi:hypothetical protein